MSRISRWSVLAVAVVTVAGGLVATATPAAAYPSDVVQFDGHGWGHGRGLGQYGSLGYSVDEGFNYAQIVDHYYGGTTPGIQPDGPVTVRLTEFDKRDMLVRSASAFTVGGTAFAAGEAALVHRSPAGYDLSRAASCSGPWMPVTSLPAGSAPEAITAYVGDDVLQMLRTCGPTGNIRSYRGTLKLVANATSSWVVNTLPMEQYLRGVVPRESPASWGSSGGGKGIEALKAQAVAARSYAWAENRSPGLFKTCDTTACQVYGGAGLNGVRIESNNSDAAVVATAGQVRMNAKSAVARTEFSSSTGGYTAGGNFTAVPDAGDAVSANPNHSWTTTVAVAKIETAYPAIGTLQSLAVTARNGLGQDGGRAKTVVLTGTGGSVTTTGDSLRSKLGLRSDWFYITDPALNAPAVGLASSGTGFVLTSTIGEAMPGHGGATYGSLEGKVMPKPPVVAIASTPTGKGYWLVGADGAVYRFGDAADVGTLKGKVVPKPIVGVAATKTGLGLWLVADNGAVYTLGDAAFLGSMFAKKLNAPILGMAVTSTGSGYWLLGRDGGVFSFGDARFFGSTGAKKLNKPILGMTADPTGHGYWFTASDGGIFTFIDQPGRFYGSAGAVKLTAPIVGMAATPTGQGYWLLGQKGAVYAYGDATSAVVPPSTTTTTTPGAPTTTTPSTLVIPPPTTTTTAHP